MIHLNQKNSLISNVGARITIVNKIMFYMLVENMVAKKYTATFFLKFLFLEKKLIMFIIAMSVLWFFLVALNLYT